ncbi:phosphoribosyl-AMP cyclohydrolase [Brevibacterium picturae]|uniref:Phosphoribosyl-AMP cyclohydrolase n=1 Tax=Brevibacterium picturae TaxID=260553 RepID=A0ABP4MB80_9MICO
MNTHEASTLGFGSPSDANPENWRELIMVNADGLIPVIVQEVTTREVLMMAWMDTEAIERTLRDGRAVYWSRSRQEYWVKGETSGHTQKVVSLSLDCDADALLLEVEQTGPACHTLTPTCFTGRTISAN